MKRTFPGTPKTLVWPEVSGKSPIPRNLPCLPPPFPGTPWEHPSTYSLETINWTPQRQGCRGTGMLKPIQNCDRCNVSNGAPKGSQGGSQGPQVSRRVPKGSQRSPGRLPGISRGPPRAPKGFQGGPLGSHPWSPWELLSTKDFLFLRAAIAAAVS